EKTHRQLIRWERNLVNLNDPTEAALNPEGWTESYAFIVNSLRTKGYKHGPELAKLMESLRPTAIQAADVYMPFVAKHPECLKIEKRQPSSDEQGRTVWSKGKHDVIVDLDFDAFRAFTEQFLH
ncbi:hypothetical protein KY329_03535, partial [Candidatus Woesearchaeota archaeon]|nr:hypothetical protein [Candidatus Woesearchaeota archaeon]